MLAVESPMTNNVGRPGPPAGWDAEETPTPWTKNQNANQKNLTHQQSHTNLLR